MCTCVRWSGTCEVWLKFLSSFQSYSKKKQLVYMFSGHGPRSPCNPLLITARSTPVCLQYHRVDFSLKFQNTNTTEHSRNCTVLPTHFTVTYAQSERCCRSKFVTSCWNCKVPVSLKTAAAAVAFSAASSSPFPILLRRRQKLVSCAQSKTWQCSAIHFILH